MLAEIRRWLHVVEAGDFELPRAALWLAVDDAAADVVLCARRRMADERHQGNT